MIFLKVQKLLNFRCQIHQLVPEIYDLGLFTRRYVIIHLRKPILACKIRHLPRRIRMRGLRCIWIAVFGHFVFITDPSFSVRLPATWSPVEFCLTPEGCRGVDAVCKESNECWWVRKPLLMKSLRIYSDQGVRYLRVEIYNYCKVRLSYALTGFLHQIPEKGF